jgi:hypothetical protein
VYRKNILIYVQQDATLHGLFYLETALQVSEGSSTHYQERKNCIYSIWYLSNILIYMSNKMQRYTVYFIWKLLS